MVLVLGDTPLWCDKVFLCCCLESMNPPKLILDLFIGSHTQSQLSFHANKFQPLSKNTNEAQKLNTQKPQVRCYIIQHQWTTWRHMGHKVVWIIESFSSNTSPEAHPDISQSGSTEALSALVITISDTWHLHCQISPIQRSCVSFSLFVSSKSSWWQAVHRWNVCLSGRAIWQQTASGAHAGLASLYQFNAGCSHMQVPMVTQWPGRYRVCVCGGGC